MNGLRVSFVLSFVEKYSSLVIQFGVSMIVARLLTPEEFGVFAVAYAIVGFAQVIREMGVNSYIVQKHVLESRDIRASLFLTLVTAWLLAVILFAFTPAIKSAYGSEVRMAVYVLLLNFFTMPVSSTIFAVLQREMRFDLLLRINLAGAVANGACAVALAMAGWGYMSLAWACVVGQLVSAIAASLCRPQLEHFLPSSNGVRDVFRFGSVVMLGTVLSQVSTNIASLITAKFVSLEAMGLLSRGQSVTGLFSKLIMDGIQPLVLPLLSQMKRADADVSAAFAQLLSYICILTWPFFCFVSIFSTPVIIVMFGEQWKEVAYLLQLMSIGGLFWVVQPVAHPLLIALGRVTMILRIQAINQAIAIIGVLIAATYGIEAVAMASIPISAAHGCMWLVCATSVVRVQILSLIRVSAVAAVVTAISMAPTLVLMNFRQDFSNPEILMAGTIGAGLGWLLGVFVCRHPISAEIRGAILHVRQAALRRVGA